ncbi:hypothetical protein Y1Q_0009987 [Alligator mississippiensis]|uniref:Uncharacterized protein n=1 Tax=Alligator mississippiensis TaxID=8496 RepID=A0A151ML59_ALLMI|nr:hypothetical protein Y1Q_0009987 [Alligator mississippiensis]
MQNQCSRKEMWVSSRFIPVPGSMCSRDVTWVERLPALFWLKGRRTNACSVDLRLPENGVSDILLQAVIQQAW